MNKDKSFFKELNETKYRSVETCMQSDQDMKRVERWLCQNLKLEKEVVEQLLFVVKTTLTGCFVNQCQDATKEFAENLITRFGEELSFFDLASDVEFFDVRSKGPFNNSNQRIKYHSVAVLDFGGKEKVFLICDLTYGLNMQRGDKKNILFLVEEGDMGKVTELLSKKYGGKWDFVYRFNKKNKKFEFID